MAVPTKTTPHACDSPRVHSTTDSSDYGTLFATRCSHCLRSLRRSIARLAACNVSGRLRAIIADRCATVCGRSAQLLRRQYLLEHALVLLLFPLFFPDAFDLGLDSPVHMARAWCKCLQMGMHQNRGDIESLGRVVSYRCLSSSMRIASSSAQVRASKCVHDMAIRIRRVALTTSTRVLLTGM